MKLHLIHNSLSIENSATPPPAFMENDYFCDTGSNDHWNLNDDPMGDGAGCGPLNTCCSFSMVLLVVTKSHH